MLAAVALAIQSPFTFNVASGTGLTLSVQGVPLIRGSWFQYYEPGWTKGYYSQFTNQQKIERKPDGTMVMTFRSQDGRAHGSQTFTPAGNGLKAKYEFRWDGESPVLVEMTPGMLWAPALQAGKLSIDGTGVRSLQPTTYQDGSIQGRTYGTGASFSFQNPFANLTFNGGGEGWTLFDARGYGQDWARGKELFWLGRLAVEVTKEKPAELEVEWNIDTVANAPQGSTRLDARVSPMGAAAGASEERLPLIPKPKEVSVDYEKPLFLQSREADPLRYGIIFQTTLGNLWDTAGMDGPAQVSGSFKNIGLPAEGYEIEVTAKGATIVGQDAVGLRHGMRTLAMLAYARDGKLALPQGKIRDWPSTTWRGVHLFIGPTALGFHQKLWERVLLPMKFNKVVLQAERANWRAVPGTETSITMNRDDLARLVTWYRLMMVEPIPLIQSFGHMEWMFANGKNLDLAFNKEVPYAVDPRNPKTRDLLAKLWAEVFFILKPRTVHFGLDEVDMRGFPEDPELVTQLWEQHLPFLAGLAQKEYAKFMLWGDKGLAPGEAPDAAHGDSKEHAQRRRAAIPKGAMIADWHYKADQNPKTFLPPLQLWKKEGFQPIASMWYRPENIRGFVLAALQEGAGILQTTWAGYESSEENMVKELRQFSAMILAADYAWSGRQEPLEELGYQADAVFRRLYFGTPTSLRATAGSSIVSGQAKTEVRLGEVKFRLFGPLALGSLLGDTGGPATLTLPVSFEAAEVAMAVDTQTRLDDGEMVAEVVVTLADGSEVRHRLVYGRHVRAAGDPGNTLFAERARGLSVVRIPLQKRQKVSSLAIRSLNPAGGLRVHGITVL